MASPGSVVVQFITKADQAARDALGFAKSLGKVDDAASDVDASLRDAQRAIDKTGTVAAQTAPDLQKVDTALDSVGDEAENTARRLRQSAGQMASGIREGSTKIDTETGHIRQNMADTGKEAGAEFIGNVAEGIGSGTANINDIVSGTLGGLTNLTASLGGPVGAAAGIAAAGIGLVFAAVKGQSEKARAEIATLRDALKEIGSVSSKAAREIIFQTWVTEAEKVPGKITAVNSAIKTAKVSADDFQRALAGDQAARDRVTKALTDQYSKILKNKRETGNITDEQKKYLKTTETILQDLGTQKSKVAAVKSEQDALNELTGTTAKKVKNWKGNLDDTATVMALLKRQAESIEGNHPVNFIVTTKDKTGRPVHLGPAQLSVPGGGAVAPMATTASIAPITVNVDARGGVSAPRDARELVAMLETHQLRMGRKPGQPRARAW